jgi:4-diphosphocytidyl-2-C-methyl-D-erythritol kinase
MDGEAAVTRRIRVLAPAKINWTLEVLRIRPDGYHDLATVLQTIDLHDVITLTDADGISLSISGDAGMLGDSPPEANLAYRAAVAFRERTGLRRGVHIEIEKHVPVAAGLGGGSSDAAAVIRGLNTLWGADQPAANLIEIAGEVGSDPPFFIAGGTAVATGRGEIIEMLPDAVAPSILLATPPEHERGEKTASMYDALSPDHFADGYVTIGVREIVQNGRMIVDDDLNNTFEHVTARMQPETEMAMDALRAQGYVPHLAGAGPSFYLLFPGGTDVAHELSVRIRDLGFEPRPVCTLSRDEALHIEEL